MAAVPLLYHLATLSLIPLAALLYKRTQYLYFAVTVICLCGPRPVSSHNWTGVFFVIAETPRFLLAVWLTWTLFDRTSCRLYDAERRAISGFGACIGLALSLIAWVWQPENWIQGYYAVRQYGYLILACETICSWVWLKWVRPVQVGKFYAAWCGWLCCAALMAAGGKNGLLVRPWHDSGNIWYVLGLLGLTGQASIAVAVLRSLNPREA